MTDTHPFPHDDLCAAFGDRCASDLRSYTVPKLAQWYVFQSVGDDVDTALLAAITAEVDRRYEVWKLDVDGGDGDDDDG